MLSSEVLVQHKNVNDLRIRTGKSTGERRGWESRRRGEEGAGGGEPETRI